MEDIGVILLLPIFIFMLFCFDNIEESEKPIIESSEICNIEGCTIYTEEQIEKVLNDKAKTCIYFKDNTFICTGHENVKVKYKEVIK